jgi:hypothetical protein
LIILFLQRAELRRTERGILKICRLEETAAAADELKTNIRTLRGPLIDGKAGNRKKTMPPAGSRTDPCIGGGFLPERSRGPIVDLTHLLWNGFNA